MTKTSPRTGLWLPLLSPFLVAVAALGQSSGSQIGREVAIPTHLQDGDEFNIPLGQGFSLALHAPSAPVKSGSEVRLRVTVTNTSDHDILFVRSPGIVPDEEMNYQIEIRDTHGQEPPITPFFRELKARNYGWGSYLSYTLEPGKSFEDDLVITRLYTLKPGEYAIRVARGIRPIWQNLKQDTVKSNTTTLTVTK